MADVAARADPHAVADFSPGFDHGVRADRDALAELHVRGDHSGGVDAGFPRRRFLGEHADHRRKGVVDVFTDDQRTVFSGFPGQIGADQYDAGLRAFELMLVFPVADERELVGLWHP